MRSDLFSNTFSLFSSDVPCMMKGPANDWRMTNSFIQYKWDGNKIYIAAPGCTKDDITETKINGKNFHLKWNSKFGMDGDLLVEIPEKTQNIDVDVTNGMITVTFDIQKSDISININGGSIGPP